MISALPRIAIATHDFDGALETFRDRFGMPIIDLSEKSVEGLGARLAMCVPRGGSNIELMAPADEQAPLSKSLNRFLEQRGEGLFALMLEAADPNSAADVLAKRGLSVLPLMEGAGGRDVHPRSTGGVLIRIYPDGSFQGRDASPAQTPLVSGIDRVIVAVPDVDKIAKVYRRGLGLDVGPRVMDEHRGVFEVLVTPPRGARIELVSPVDLEQPFARDINDSIQVRRGGMVALVLRVEDSQVARRVLVERGLEVEDSTGAPRSPVQINAHGARLLIEESRSSSRERGLIEGDRGPLALPRRPGLSQ